MSGECKPLEWQPSTRLELHRDENLYRLAAGIDASNCITLTWSQLDTQEATPLVITNFFDPAAGEWLRSKRLSPPTSRPVLITNFDTIVHENGTVWTTWSLDTDRVDLGGDVWWTRFSGEQLEWREPATIVPEEEPFDTIDPEAMDVHVDANDEDHVALLWTRFDGVDMAHWDAKAQTWNKPETVAPWVLGLHEKAAKIADCAPLLDPLSSH